MFENRLALALLGSLLFSSATTLPAQVVPFAEPETNPARPTVSTPATLTPAGYLQFENGVLYASHSPEFSTRLGIEQVTKISVDKRVQFLALFEPFTHSTGAAVSGNRCPTPHAPTERPSASSKPPCANGPYARTYSNSLEPQLNLELWLHDYNFHRPHARLNLNTPASRSGLKRNNLLTLHNYANF